MTNVFPLAKQQWDSDEGCRQLVEHWETSAGKHQAERTIAELAERCPEHNSVIDLGCGPGRLVPWMAMFDSYQGFDWSEHMIALSQKEWKSGEKRSFIQRNAFDGSPTRKWPDLLLCIDLSRHYVDPLAFLLMVTERWPAHHYLFSVLHGAVEEELINGAVVSTESLDELQGSFGTLVDSAEQSLPGNRLVRYMLIKKRVPELEVVVKDIPKQEVATKPVKEIVPKVTKKRGRPKKISGV